MDSVEGSVVCPNGHSLRFEPAGRGGWSCDMSGELGGCCRGGMGYFEARSVARWRCRTDDYDLCDDCYQKMISTGQGVVQEGEKGKEETQETGEETETASLHDEDRQKEDVDGGSEDAKETA
uniref:ZZ-type domain-containing protein n=1 Tax=Chromera velia CCMP2878 TaxID=1169474 RepID=A0A0G4I2A1_9ALVE|eukprot:Cvel_10338.t1-p1 / transcript=Cvel_10338.t1 / gene=Cvel_10338 / organism=Chromera_velia_CCMP2878 / gene_product=hypothetical protein / transcript_product=hypothetical protein / location=Cvel_scaffold621:15253-15615(+) / protein_length=121 / sequence_SO=supercontig / SO=protein_coding / is_pseudo=false